MKINIFPQGSSNVTIIGNDNYLLLQLRDNVAPIFKNQILPLGGSHEISNPYLEAMRELGEELSLDGCFNEKNLILNYVSGKTKKILVEKIHLNSLGVWLLSLEGTKLSPKYTHFVNWNYSLNLKSPVKNLQLSEGKAFTCSIYNFNSENLPIASNYGDVINFSIGRTGNFAPNAEDLDRLLSLVNAKKPEELKKYK